MRLLLLITDLEIGGTPTVVGELTVSLSQDKRVDVEAACLATAGPVADQLRSAGVNVTALGASGPRDVAVIFSLIKLIRNRSFDTVFSFLIHANAVAAVAKIFCPRVRFIQSIQTTQPEPAWHWKLQGLIQHAAENIVVPSASVVQAARDWSHIPKEKITVISNGVKIEDFAQIAARDVGRPIRKIGFIGRLDPIKRIDDLVEAMTHVEKSLQLDIYGDGPQRKAIDEHIRTLNLQDRVKLQGAIARPQEALGQIDLLVLPSQAEGFGLVLIEAMAAGVPVVATNVPGIRDVVKDGETGLLVPARDSRALARAIDRVASDAALRRSLIDAARRDVAARFSWRRVMGEYRSLLHLT